MQKRQLWIGIFAFLCLMILILDSRTALSGAQTGVELCIKTVIPSLFPFFILSILLTGSLMGMSLPFLIPLGKVFRIPEGAESILLSSFLGGYPAGAQSISTAYRSGQLSLTDARRLLTFCNNAGPAFLFGMVRFLFPESAMVWALWGIHILSALLYARLCGPAGSSAAISCMPQTSSQTMTSAIRAMATVCGWVILFRVILAFLQRWFLWYVPPVIQIVITGILELANGCCSLDQIGNLSLRFLVCAGILSFGGVCVTMQTISVAGTVFHRGYFTAKLVQTVFSLCFAVCFISGIWYGIPLIILFVSLVSRIKQKNVAFSGRVVYNADITQGRT